MTLVCTPDVRFKPRTHHTFIQPDRRTRSRLHSYRHVIHMLTRSRWSLKVMQIAHATNTFQTKVGLLVQNFEEFYNEFCDECTQIMDYIFLTSGAAATPCKHTAGAWPSTVSRIERNCNILFLRYCLQLGRAFKDSGLPQGGYRAILYM